jgi:hypothetical protein
MSANSAVIVDHLETTCLDRDHIVHLNDQILAIISSAQAIESLEANLGDLGCRRRCGCGSFHERRSSLPERCPQEDPGRESTDRLSSRSNSSVLTVSLTQGCLYPLRDCDRFLTLLQLSACHLHCPSRAIFHHRSASDTLYRSAGDSLRYRCLNTSRVSRGRMTCDSEALLTLAIRRVHRQDACLRQAFLAFSVSLHGPDVNRD